MKKPQQELRGLSGVHQSFPYKQLSAHGVQRLCHRSAHMGGMTWGLCSPCPSPNSCNTSWRSQRMAERSHINVRERSHFSGPSEKGRKHKYLRETFCMSGRARGSAALGWERIEPPGTEVQVSCPGPTSPAVGRVPLSPVCPHPSPLHLLGSDGCLRTFPFGGCFRDLPIKLAPLLKDFPQLCSLTSQFKCDQPQHSACDVSRAKGAPLDMLGLSMGDALLHSLHPRR